MFFIKDTTNAISEYIRCTLFVLPTYPAFLYLSGISVFVVRQAKITLGFNASTDLNEMTEETIHKHFMAKLQLVSGPTRICKCLNLNLMQDNYDNAPETAVSSNAYHDYHEVKKNICVTFYCLYITLYIL